MRPYRPWRRRLFIALVAIAVLAFVFRGRILSGLGSYLIATDEPEKVEAAFVLGGASYERGLEAIDVLNSGFTDMAVCTGGNVPSILAALDTVLFEADVTRQFMINRGIPGDRVVALTTSTSTMEESEEILRYCQTEGLKSIMIISSTLHMRRVRKVFEDKFEDAGIAVNFHGAASQQFDEEEWWKDEAGLIMTNNEYMKLVYYALKY